MKHPASILQTEKECYICRALGRENTSMLDKHHIYGAANRDASEENGLWVWLCVDHHTAAPNAVHRKEAVNRELKRVGQKRFERSHCRGEFMAIFHRSYL